MDRGDNDLGEVIRILLVDDQTLTGTMLERMLANAPDLALHARQDPTQAIKAAEEIRPSVILLDIVMPELDGLMLLGMFRATAATRDIPIIMLSVQEDPEIKARAFSSGANDYLIKLPDKMEMIARLRYHAGAYDNLKRRRQAEERYRSLFQNSRDALFLIRAEEGVVETCNRAAVRLFNRSCEEIEGRSLSDIHPPVRDLIASFDADPAEGIDAAFSGDAGAPGSEETFIPVEVSLVRFTQEGRPLILALYRDISERKRIEETRLAREAAEAASLAKGEFLAVMSHEIRTPMNAILGMADLLRDPGMDEEQLDCLDTIQQAGRGLLKMIDDILELVRADSAEFVRRREPFHLRELIQVVADLIERQAHDKGLGFSSHVDAGLPEVLVGDASQLRQALINLLGNAVKFTQAGKIDLLAQADPEEAGWVRFTIRDTGIGIPENQLDAIFRPFTQADSSSSRAYEGTGLGLTICKRFVTSMGGRIEVESLEGEGSAFHIVLPLETEAS